MSYDQLISLYFERSNALQDYWTLYVVIVGGLLAFSSLRKHPAPLTTLIVSILFVLFAYENHDAIQATTRQRLATLEAIKGAGADNAVHTRLEPTMKPATPGSVSTTHIVSDLLTLAGLWAMEYGRRKNRRTSIPIDETD